MGLFSKLFGTRPSQPAVQIQPIVPRSASYGSTRPENNASWQELSDAFMYNIQNGFIGAAAICRFEQGRIREAEKDYPPAIRLYMDSFFYHATGLDDLNSTRRFGVPPSVAIPPAIVRRIQMCVKKAKLSDSDVRKLYFSNQHPSDIPMAVYSYEKAWNLLRKALKDGIDSCDGMIRRAESSYKKEHPDLNW